MHNFGTLTVTNSVRDPTSQVLSLKSEINGLTEKIQKLDDANKALMTKEETSKE